MLKRVMVQTVHGCNYRCLICPLSKRAPGGVKIMAEELFEKILHDCTAIPTLAAFMPYLMSEPLLDPHLPERIELARSYLPRARLFLVTNGSRLHGRLAERLVSGPLDELHLSINAWWPETVARLTGRKDWEGIRERLLAAIRQAISARGSDFIKVSVTRAGPVLGDDELAELSSAVESAGVRRLAVHERPVTRAGNVVIDDWLPAVHHPAICGCHSVWTENMLHVLWDGRVIPCCHDYQARHVLGNLNRESIAEVWTGEGYRAFRRALCGAGAGQELICHHCEMARVPDHRVAREVSLPAAKRAAAKPRRKLALIRPRELWPGGVGAHRRRWTEALLAAVLAESGELEVAPIDAARLAAPQPAALLAECDGLLVHLDGGTTTSLPRLTEELERFAAHLPLAVFGRGTADPAWHSRLHALGAGLILQGMPARPWISALESWLAADGGARAPTLFPPVLPDWDFLPGGAFVDASQDPPVMLVRTALGQPDRPVGSGVVAFEGPYRPRDLTVAGEEIVRALRTADVGTVEVLDFAPDHGDEAALTRWLELCERCGPALRWTLPLDGRTAVSEELAGRLASAGVERIRAELVSGSKALRRATSISVEPTAVAGILRAAHRQAIATELVVVTGAPGETPADRARTAAWLAEQAAAIDQLYLQRFVPEPGSEVMSAPNRFGISWPSGGEAHEWIDRRGSNASLRAKYLGELLEHARELGIRAEAPGVEKVADVARHREPIRRRYRDLARAGAEVVLATTPPWGTANPPLGLGYLAEALAEAGRSCRIVDGNAGIFRHVESQLRHLWHYENKNFWSVPEAFAGVERELDTHLGALADEIVSGHPMLVGLSVVDPKELCTAALIRRIRSRRPELPILLGGPACLEIDRRRMIAELVGDHVVGFVSGEGETPIVEIADRVAAGRPPEGSPGFVPISDVGMPVSPWREDLRRIRYPRFAKFSPELYGRSTVLVEWSRGCIGRCTFCKGCEISGAYRHREPQDVVAELCWHADRGVKSFTVCDSELNGNVRFLRRVCELAIGKGIGIDWRGQALPLRVMTADLVQLMRKAGCIEIQYGIESGSDRVLAVMGKSRLFSASVAEAVIRRTHEAGIAVALFLIVGHPGETEEDFVQTLEFIRRNADWIDSIKSVNTLHVIEGTALHRRPAEFGIVLPAGAWHRSWYGADGSNTPELRRERALRLLELARELAIPVREHNLDDDKAARALAELGAGEFAGEALRRSIAVPELRASDAGVEVESGPIRHDRISGRRPRGPETVEVELAAACNLRCVGCWCHSPLLPDDRHRELQAAGSLPTPRLLELLAELASLGTSHVQLSGSGEPLINRDAVEIVACASDLGMSTTLVTNGSLLTPHRSRELVDAGLERVTVSVWAGDRETWARLHPGVKSELFTQLTENLKALAALRDAGGKPAIKLYHVISQLNATNVESMVDHALAVDADQIEFQLMDLSAHRGQDLGLGAEEVRELERAFANLRARPEYSDCWSGQPPLRRDALPLVRQELWEFGRFLRIARLPGFSLAGPQRLRCPRGYTSDPGEPQRSPVFHFSMDPELCAACSRRDACFPKGRTGLLRVPTLELTGAGSFLRRVRSAVQSVAATEAAIVRDLPCVVGRLYSRIDYRGNVLACCKGSRVPLGNVAAQPFAQVWDSPPYQEFCRHAEELPKDHPYFEPFACLEACDNLGMNLRAQYGLGAEETT
ncbi:MAG: radical SAM protein [bacterium]|nr:radical SAM protein [bacterium]